MPVVRNAPENKRSLPPLPKQQGPADQNDPADVPDRQPPPPAQQGADQGAPVVVMTHWRRATKEMLHTEVEEEEVMIVSRQTIMRTSTLLTSLLKKKMMKKRRKMSMDSLEKNNEHVFSQQTRRIEMLNGTHDRLPIISC